MHFQALIGEAVGREYAGGAWRRTFDEGAKWLSRLRRANPTTVIVPIFNSAPSVRRLLRSLEQIEDVALVVLVDDHSTDEETAELCRSWSNERDDALCIRSSRNRGFVESVNRGIEASVPGSDLLVLNSDACLAPFTVRKLRCAAASAPDVATVSPVSNAAGVFSLPLPKVNNDIPANWSNEGFALLVELVAGPVYEDIPSGTGFCLYVTRAAIESVGVFDHLLFHRGYGEESDFCRRALHRGMRCLVDMSAFVFHEREVSFGLEKIELKRRNSGVLKALDPSFVADSLAWEERTRLRSLWQLLSPFAEARPPVGCEKLVEACGARRTLRIAEEGKRPDEVGRGSSTIVVTQGRGRRLNLFDLAEVNVELADDELLDLIVYLAMRWRVDDVVDETDRFLELLDQLAPRDGSADGSRALLRTVSTRPGAARDAAPDGVGP